MGVFDFFKKNVTTNTTQESAALQLQQRVRQWQTGSWKTDFISDIYNESTLYPHDEMLTARKALMYNAWIAAAVQTLSDFLYGGECKVVSEDEKLAEFLNQYLIDSKLGEMVPLIFTDLISFGNFYTRKIPVKLNGKYGKQKVPFYEYIHQPEKMYHVVDEANFIEEFVLQNIQGDNTTGGVHTITYYGNVKKQIRGQKFKKEEIGYTKMGHSIIPSYGRGALAVLVNDVKIVLEIERAMAVFARFKANPKKLIQLPRADPRSVADFTSNLNNIPDEENPITNLPNVTIHDLSYGGKDASYNGLIDYFKRKLTVALAPEFIIHGENTNRATSKEQRAAFLLRAKSIREGPKKWLEAELNKFLDLFPRMKGEFSVEFGDFDVGEDTETREFTMQAWQSGLMKLKDAQEHLGLPVDDSDMGEFYSHELTSSALPPGLSFGAEEKNKSSEDPEDNS